MSVRAPTTHSQSSQKSWYEEDRKSQELEPTQVIEHEEIEIVFPEEAEPSATQEYTEPVRLYPPISLYDTVIGFNQLKHRHVDFVKDAQILKKHPVYRKDKYTTVTETGKHVVQQQTQRSCVPAALSMLFLDLGGSLLEREIRTYNLTSDRERDRLLETRGFRPITTSLRGDKDVQIVELQKLVAVGPGILDISSTEAGGHTVVLDALTEESATFRDPYHGWMITISIDTFKKWDLHSFIQLGKVVL